MRIVSGLNSVPYFSFERSGAFIVSTTKVNWKKKINPQNKNCLFFKQARVCVGVFSFSRTTKQEKGGTQRRHAPAEEEHAASLSLSLSSPGASSECVRARRTRTASSSSFKKKKWHHRREARTSASKTASARGRRNRSSPQPRSRARNTNETLSQRRWRA